MSDDMKWTIASVCGVVLLVAFDVVAWVYVIRWVKS